MPNLNRWMLVAGGSMLVMTAVAFAVVNGIYHSWASGPLNFAAVATMAFGVWLLKDGFDA